jgi:transposase
MTPDLYVGIDVAKAQLDLARSDRDHVEPFANDESGIDALVASLREAKPQLIVIESTGGLERSLVAALLDAGLPAALVHSGRVRNMAKALGVLGKTDKIDARMLIAFGRHAQPRISHKASQNRTELSDLVSCRRQLITTRVQQSNRLASTVSSHARKSLGAVLEALDEQIHSLDKQIRKLINADDDFRDAEKILLSVPGIGPTLAATLLADMPELGKLERQPICALVGVAPFNNDSGGFKGARRIRGGRTAVRNALYMGAITATVHNPLLRAFAQRLKDKGKKSKVVIVAVMRKLLSLINVMLRDGLTWDQLNVVKNLSTNP